MVVRNLQEVRELKELLERITGFIADYGEDEYLDDPDFKYACNVADALAWVLGEIDTGEFTAELPQPRQTDGHSEGGKEEERS